MAEDQKARMRRNRARIWYYAAAAYAASATAGPANVQFDFAGAQMAVTPGYGDFTNSLTVFSPTSLFTTEKGFIWDFTNPNNLRQQISGTGTVSTAGDRVTLILDTSPNGFNGTYINGGAESASFTRSGSYNYVVSQQTSGDNSGFSLTLSAVKACLDGKSVTTAIIGLRREPGENWGNNDWMGFEASLSGGCAVRVWQGFSIAGNQGIRYFRQDGANFDEESGVDYFSLGYIRHIVHEVNWAAGTRSTWLNNVLTWTGTFTAGVSPTSTAAQIRAGGNSTNKKLFYCILIDRALTSTERDNLWTWGRALIGA